MLEPNRPNFPARSSQTSLRDIWAGLKRNRAVILLSTVATVSATTAVILLSRPQFESEATLRFVSQETESALLSRLPEGLADIAGPSIQGDDIDTEIGVLRSRRVAEAVVDSFSLHVALRKPAVPRDSVLRILDAPRDAPVGQFTLRRRADGSFGVSARRTKGRAVRLPERVELGVPFEIGSARMVLAPLGEVPDAVVLRISPFNETVEDFRDDLKIQKQEGRSRLVEVLYRDPDRRLAAGIVNAVVDNFLAYRTSADHSDLRHRVEALREQVGSHQAELRQAEEALRGYRERFRIVEPEEEAIQHVRMLAEIRGEREQAVIERDALRRVFTQLENAPPSASGSRYRELAAFPSFITNQGVQQILESLMVLEESRSQLLLRRTSRDQEVVRVEQRIEELENQLRILARDYLRSLDTTIASADASLARFGAELQSVPQREMEYARLVRETRLLNQVYLGLQARLRDAEIQYASAPPEVRVVDPAIVADEPAWPKPAVMLILATMLGLMVGVVVSVTREAMDDKVRSQSQAELAAGGVPVVGMIPHMPHLSDGNGWRRRLAWRWRSTPLLRRGAPSIPAEAEEARPRAVVTRYEPDHHAAEAYRALRTTLVTSGNGAQPQVLAIASPLPGEGKSTSAANLAVTLAQQGNRVLLIDGDLRRGTLHSLLGAQRAPGLADVLGGTHDPTGALQELDIDNPGAPSLHLLVAGTPPARPTELLGSPAMGELLTRFRGEYDRIVIDSPALQSAADGFVIAGLADSVLLVLRAGTTDRGVAQQTATRLRRMHVAVGGVILNDLDRTGTGDYDSFAYSTPDGYYGS